MRNLEAPRLRIYKKLLAPVLLASTIACQVQAGQVQAETNSGPLYNNPLSMETRYEIDYAGVPRVLIWTRWNLPYGTMQNVGLGFDAGFYDGTAHGTTYHGEVKVDMGGVHTSSSSGPGSVVK